MKNVHFGNTEVIDHDSKFRAEVNNGGFEDLGGSLNAWTVFGNVSAADEAVLDGD